ncbi:MAG: hypothetical protein ABIJ96_12055 [Elusimicrobiota bacterium]
MRLVVCAKQVPETSAVLKVSAGALDPQPGGFLPAMNPYDEFALEAALRLREGTGSGEIVLLTATSEPVEEMIFHGLAMGADRAVVLDMPPGRRPDPLATGRLLARELRELRPDIVLCGERAVDDDAAQVGAVIAEELSFPQIAGVESVELNAAMSALRARSRRGPALQVYACPLPCVLTFARGPELPRYPSLEAIQSAAEKRVERRFCDPGENVVERVELFAADEERGGELIRGAAEKAVELLLDRIDSRTDVL